MAPTPFVIRGRLLHTPQRRRIEVVEDGAIEVGRDGRIVALHEGAAAADAATRLPTLDLLSSQLLIPGLVDTHVHAPQWPQMGTALNLSLEEWLAAHTFPLEARFADVAFAERVYRSLIEALVANGTTTAAYYATIHLPASMLLAELCLEAGQRAFVGLVMMDDPEQCPEGYRHAGAGEAIDATERFVAGVLALRGNTQGRVAPMVTPRFIPSCTDEALAGAGRIARETGCAVQTHCSESDWQHGYVLARHGMRDSESLERFGLLTGRTVLAHGNFMNDDDADRILSAGSSVAHCPLSNFYFSNAIFPARRMLDRGLKVGLGTDIGGGPSASILENARAAAHAARVLEEGVHAELAPHERGHPGARLTPADVLWMATRGGAQALGIDTGAFVPGFEFDAVVLDTDAPHSNLVLFDGLDGPDQIAEKVLYSAGRQNVVRVYCQGREI